MRKDRLLATLAGLGAALVATTALTSCSSTSGSDLSADITIEKNSEFGSFSKNTLYADDIEVKILEAEFIDADKDDSLGEDRPLLEISYETTNTTDSGVDVLAAWFTHFRAVQNLDDSTSVELGIADSASDLHHEIPIPEVGKPVQNSITYQLSEPDLPVELIATDARSNKIASLVFER